MGKFHPPSRPWPQSVLCRPGWWLLWRNFWWWTGQAPLSCGQTDACGPVVRCGMGAGVLGDPVGAAMAVSCLRAPVQRPASELPRLQESQAGQGAFPALASIHRGLVQPETPPVLSGVELPHLWFPGPFRPSWYQSPYGPPGQAPLRLPGAILTVLTCMLCSVDDPVVNSLSASGLCVPEDQRRV